MTLFRLLDFDCPFKKKINSNNNNNKLFWLMSSGCVRDQTERPVGGDQILDFLQWRVHKRFQYMELNEDRVKGQMN